MPKQIPYRLLTKLASFLTPEDYKITLRGVETDRICSFRVNTLKSTPEEIETFLAKNDIPFERISFLPLAYTIPKEHEYALKGSPIFYGGKIYLQGLASQIPATLLDLQPNMRVFDVTAAPGSKTTQMAALMGNTGSIVACEKHQIRHDKLLHNLKLQGATNVEAHKIDATKLKETLEPGSFDAVLLDAPCSAEGRIRADDERSFGFWRPENIIEKVKLQKSLLDATIPLLKSGGTLVYSTCTLSPEENEGMIDTILREHSDLKLEPISIDFEFARPWLTKFQDTIYKDDLRNTLRLLPSSLAEGFFVAKLRKM